MAYSQALEEQVARIRGYETMQLPDDHRHRLMYTQVYAMLQQAETYYWAPEICTTICGISVDMPQGWTYRHDRLPTPMGFAWFARPIGWRFPEAPDLGLTSGDVALQAVVWKSAHLEDESAPSPRRLVICGFGCEDGDGEPVVSGLLEEGQPIESWMGRDGLTTDLYALKLVCLRVFAACMSFLEQRILVAPHQRAERHTRKRLERQGYLHEPLIRVVELRRKPSRSEHHGESEPVAWSHQWIVSGHWRQQPYPTLGITQPRWIMPHLKGPPDRPLKPPRAKIFAVIR